MSAPRLFSWLLAAAALLPPAQAQNQFEGTFIGGGANGTNVLNNTCSRIHAQVLVKDENAWIDGGINTFVQWKDQNPTWVTPYLDTIIAGVNNYTIQIPLNATWDWKTNMTQIAHDKNPNPGTGSPPPVVINGALYSGITGDPRIWLFGGTTSYINTSFPGWQYPQADQYTLWSYDTNTNVWGQHDVSSLGIKTRPSNGAHAEAPDKGLAFWLDGQINSGSSQQTTDLGDNHTIFDQGLVVFNFNDEEVTVKNVSTTTMGWPRAGGVMHYAPSFGDDGILVMLGGGNKSVTDDSKDAQGSYINMTDIWVYDLAAANSSNPTSGFYLQQANGLIPEPREDFCVVGVDAPDSTSYTLYIYGGRMHDTVYDEIFALSLPSFTWSLLYSGDSPRYGHSCAMGSQRQMITFGGTNTTTNWTKTCDWETRSLAMYDIPGNQWGSAFIEPDQTAPFALPLNVSKAVGGDSTGHATIFSPPGNFTSPQLAQVMQIRYPAPEDTQNKRRKLSKGAIAGIVIGVVAGVVILASLAWWFVVRPRRNARKAAGAAARSDSADGTDSEAAIADGRPELESEARSADQQQRLGGYFEKDGHEVVHHEKDGVTLRPEMDAEANEMRFEMDAADTEVRAELADGRELGKPGSAFMPGSDMKKPLF